MKKLLAKMARLRARLAAKFRRRRIVALALVLVLCSGCSTVYRGERMTFDRCAITVHPAAGEGAGVFAQMMSADHEGDERVVPNISPTTTANVGTPASSGGTLLGKVVDAIASGDGSGDAPAASDSGCSGGGCSVDE